MNSRKLVILFMHILLGLMHILLGLGDITLPKIAAIHCFQLSTI